MPPAVRDKSEEAVEAVKVMPQTKLSYHTPRLLIFGHLEELTTRKQPGSDDGINSPLL
jgi:hypothetical protein